MSWRKGEAPDRKLWKGIRLKVLDRDGWLCVKCGRSGRMEVDHIQRLEDGGEVYELSNLQSLCRNCHIAKTRAENLEANPPRPGVKEWRDFIESRINAMI